MCGIVKVLCVDCFDNLIFVGVELMLFCVEVIGVGSADVEIVEVGDGLVEV